MDHFVESMESRTMYSANFGVAITNEVNTAKAVTVLGGTKLNASAVRYWVSTRFTSSADEKISSSELADLKAYHDAGKQVTMLVTLPTGLSSLPTGMDVKTWIQTQISTTNVEDYVDRWEIINEPDYNNYWPGGNLTSYVNNALKPAYEALHPAGQPAIGQVVGAALTDGGYSSSSNALTTLKNAGYANYSDYFNMHPYGSSYAQHKQNVTNFLSVFGTADSSVPVYGYRPNKPMVSTEWNVKPPGGVTSDDRNQEEAWETAWNTSLEQIKAADVNVFETMYYYRFAYKYAADEGTHWGSAGLIYSDTTNYDGHNPFYQTYYNWTHPTTPTNPTGSITASADAYVQGGTANESTNFGAAATEGVKQADSQHPELNRRAYLKFDISNVPASATNVTLRLNGKLNTADSVSVGVYNVSNLAWAENQITWANQPGYDAAPLASSVTVASTTSANYDFDITQAVNAAKAAGKSEIDLAVVAGSTPSTAGFYFDSKENTSGNAAKLLYTASTATVVRNAAEDAVVQGGTNADTNYSSATTAGVKQAINTYPELNRRAIVKFNIANLPATITSVKLRLNGKLNTADSVTVGAYYVPSNNWSESQVTWNTLPQYNTGVLGNTITVTSTTSADYDFDVKQAVLDARAAGESYVSIAMVAGSTPTSAAFYFDTKENTSGNGPELIVN